MSTLVTASDIVLLPVSGPLSLEDTFFCGQSFRWRRQPDGRYVGIIGSTVVSLWMEGSTLYAERLSLDEQPLDRLCDDYLDLHTDYEGLHALCQCDELLRRSVDFAGGIQILRQQPWEALCTFILSQNNNIKRITGLVERLCENFGEPVSCKDGSIWYTFPTAQRLAELTPEQLAPVRCGFRAKYVLDAAQKVASGEISLQAIYHLPTPEAMETLMQIQGVGPKVAQCALLFGWYKLDCLPRDVWIGRAMDRFFPDGFPAQVLPIAGVAQQYLFHYVRAHPEICDKK